MDITYKLVGTDGQEYGPVTLQELHAWLKEGRADATTQVKRSDVNAWHPASSYAELGLGAGTTPVVAVPESAPVGSPSAAALDEMLELDRSVKSGGSWFYWIAGLSLVNSILAFSGNGGGFIVGLSITQVIDAILNGSGGSAKVIALVLDVIVAGVFALFGVFACKRHSWAFFVGMGLYGLDTLLTLLAQYWLGVAFHAWVLFSLFLGVRAAMKANALSKGGGM